MFGKFLNKCLVSFLIGMTIPLYGNTNKILSINGFQSDTRNRFLTKALRLQGIGDYFFKKKSYAQAVPYYEEALELMPQEADITFKLGKVYQQQKLWRLSILYYQNTIELLLKPVNFGKSQLNSYISRIRIAYIYHLQGNTDESQSSLKKLREEQSLIFSSYPEAWEELKIFDMIYPELPTRKNIENQ